LPIDLPVQEFLHKVLSEWENPPGVLQGREVPRPDFLTRGDLPAQGFLHGVLSEWENPPGVLQGREVPRPDFLTRGDLPGIEDPPGIDHLSRDILPMEALTEVILVLGDSCPG
jgi:hypothetical protein